MLESRWKPLEVVVAGVLVVHSSGVACGCSDTPATCGDDFGDFCMTNILPCHFVLTRVAVLLLFFNTTGEICKF